MNYNQEILRKHTNLAMGRKDVNTSLILFPIRLETRILDRWIEEVEEPDKILYAFKAIWEYILALEYKADRLNKLRLSLRVMESIENLDIVYREDRARLQKIVQRIIKATVPSDPNDQLRRIWARIEEHIPRLATMDIVHDNIATDFLKDLKKTNHIINNLLHFPEYSSVKRIRDGNASSSNKKYKYARWQIKKCIKLMEAISPDPDDPNRDHKSILDKICIISQAQYQKYLACIKFIDTSAESITAVYDLISYTTPNGVKYKYRKSDVPIHDALTNDFDRYESVRQRIVANRNRYKNKMQSKVGKYYHYTLFAELLMMWKLDLILREEDYTSERKAERWRLLAKNTIFSFHEEREWLIHVLGYYNKFMHENEKDELMISRNRLNSHNRYIKNKKLSYKVKKRCLCTRIYPDEIAVTQLDLRLSNEEVKFGQEFWIQYAKAITDIRKKAAWEALCSRYTPARAAYVARKMFPSNFQDIKGQINRYLPEEEIEKILHSKLNFPKHQGGIEEQNFACPSTELLPDRFMIQAVYRKRGKTEKALIKYGHIIPKSIQLGVDLSQVNEDPTMKGEDENNLSNDDLSTISGMDARESFEGIKFGGNLRWMTDYDEAERMGMAITLPLDTIISGPATKQEKKLCKERGAQARTKRKMEFPAIYALGIKELSPNNTEDSKLCAKLLNDVLTTHLYSEGLSLLNIGTPTNIISDEDMFDTSIEKQTEDYYNQTIKALTSQECIPAEGSDAKILSDLFLQTPLSNYDNPFYHAFNKDNIEIKKARYVNEAFLKALKDSTPLIKAIYDNTSLNSFFINDVIGRGGALPPIRVGSQPYGILPISDFRNLRYKHSDNKLQMVKDILIKLTKRWNNIAQRRVLNEQNFNKGDSNDNYMMMMTQTPFSTTFLTRPTVENSMLLNPDYFMGFQRNETPIEAIWHVVEKYHKTGDINDLKNILAEYNKIPINDEDVLSFKKNIWVYEPWSSMYNSVRGNIPSNLNIDEKELKEMLSATFDLFNYRLDAWLTGLLNNRIRQRIAGRQHKIAIGAFGWVFNLVEDSLELEKNPDEYILAPSINHAITAAILRSSFNNSKQKASQGNFNMSINLSSVRVRQALRIIKGIRNGLSLGTILGSDLERLLHEDYKFDRDYEMDEFIYPLRLKYPNQIDNIDQEHEGQDNKSRNVSLDVINGVTLINDCRRILSEGMSTGDADRLTISELYSRRTNGRQTFFDGILYNYTYSGNKAKKMDRLVELINMIEDAYDALSDVITSESVYKLTEGNRVAVEALMQNVQNESNIPDPDVVEIPLESAHVEERVFVALNTDVKTQDNDPLMKQAEPALDEWIGEILGIDRLAMVFTANNHDTVTSTKKLGISPSEWIYLSTDNERFIHFINLQNWYIENVNNENISPTLSKYDPSKTGEISSSNGGEDEYYSFEEAELAIESLRELITNGNRLAVNDLTMAAHQSNDTIDLNELKDRIINIYDKISKYRHSLDTLYQKLRSELSVGQRRHLNSKSIRDAIGILLQCYRIGVFDAITNLSPELIVADDQMMCNDAYNYNVLLKKQEKLVEHLNSVSGIISQRLEDAETLINDENTTEESLSESIKKLLGGVFRIIPHFSLIQNEEGVIQTDIPTLHKQMLSGDYFSNVSNEKIESNLIELANVRDQMQRLHQLRLFGKWNNIDTVNNLSPLQLDGATARETHEWLGLPVSSERFVHDANVYTALNPKQLFKQKEDNSFQKVAGLMIDFWVERIPYNDQTAAVTFHYDQPDAEPPQAILFAVTTSQRAHRWSEKRLLRSILSAVHLVQSRAVEPRHIYTDRRTSGFFPLIQPKKK